MKIWIDPEWNDRLIGFEVKVFISELSNFKTVRMSPAEAMEYLSKAWADVRVVWMTDSGEIVSGFASVLKSNCSGNYPAICAGTYNRTLCAALRGFLVTRKLIQALMVGMSQLANLHTQLEKTERLIARVDRSAISKVANNNCSTMLDSIQSAAVLLSLLARLRCAIRRRKVDRNAFGRLPVLLALMRS